MYVFGQTHTIINNYKVAAYKVKCAKLEIKRKSLHFSYFRQQNEEEKKKETTGIITCTKEKKNILLNALQLTEQK